MNETTHRFEAPLWASTGQGAWYFVTLPKDLSHTIKFSLGDRMNAWGTLRVSVRLGFSKWNTSLFRDKKRDTYLLPIKADIRKKEIVSEGDILSIVLSF